MIKSLGLGNAAPLSNYTVGTFTASLTGCSTVPTGTVTYILMGSLVLLVFPTITGTSTTNAATLTGLPASLIPAQNQRQIAAVSETGTLAAGIARIGTDGVITLFPSVAGGAFTASGTKGIAQNAIPYSLVGGA